MRKEKVSFTIDKDLMSWFRLYCKDEYKTMSSVLSEHILYLKKVKRVILRQTRNLSQVNRTKSTFFFISSRESAKSLICSM